MTVPYICGPCHDNHRVPCDVKFYWRDENGNMEKFTCECSCVDLLVYEVIK